MHVHVHVGWTVGGSIEGGEREKYQIRGNHQREGQ